MLIFELLNKRRTHKYVDLVIRTKDVDNKTLRHEPQEAVSFSVKYLGYPLRADLGIQAVESRAVQKLAFAYSSTRMSFRKARGVKAIC